MIASLILALAASTPAQAALQPLSGLAGHCWRGDAPGGAGIDTHCFEWVYGGQHLRDRHVVTASGKPVYEGEALYSADANGVTFTYWNSLGGLGRGRMTVSGDALTFSGSIHGTPTGAEESLATAWRTGPDSYTITDPKAPPRLFKRID